MSPPLQELVAKLLQGDRRALARILTIVENGPADRRRESVGLLHRHGGRAAVIGITGPPGAGKSSLIARLVTEVRSRDQRIAVVAADPSSPFTRGAILGDRIRMQRHHGDPGVYIRSMAARSHLGGLTEATGYAVLALDAAGFDILVIETVGVGQSEVEVAAVADATVVTLAPGLGDGVQAVKAGVLETADVLVVNKADLPGAAQLELQLRQMLADRPQRAAPGTRVPTVMLTSSSSGEGVAELLDEVQRQLALHDPAARQERSRARIQAMLETIVLGQVQEALRAGADRSMLACAASDVVTQARDPFAAADLLVEQLMTSLGHRRTAVMQGQR